MDERTTTRYDRAEPQCYQGFGFMMRRLLVTLMVLLVAGCTRTPTKQDVVKYGENQFVDDVLAVADGKPIPERLTGAFHPIRIEPHLNGAWLVFEKSSRYEAGIYVDRKSIGGWGGSGMEVTPWSEKIAWSEEKIRR